MNRYRGWRVMEIKGTWRAKKKSVWMIALSRVDLVEMIDMREAA